MYYAIESYIALASGEKLYITDAHPKVTVTVQQNGKFRADQLWEVLYNPNNGGMCLKNKDSGSLIAVQAGNSDALLVPNTVENQNKLPDPSALLNIFNGQKSGYKLVRGLQDQDNNLNLAGNDGYKDGGIVKFWGWDSKNNDNYQWKFIGIEV